MLKKETRKSSKKNSAILEESRLLELYEKMVLLRRFELALQKLHRNGKVPGFIHLYVGEEATAVGICENLRKDDWITSTHRGHGHALAKGVSAKTILAEICGKAAGCCGGRGGSMHLYAPSDGLFGTNGIVAGGLPLATGLGLSFKTQKTDQVAVCFFGDGAANHGAFHESVNLAAIQDAPVVFVCENNLYATCIPIDTTTRNTDLAGKAAGYGIPSVCVDGNNVLEVLEAAEKAVQRARSGQGPTLIEARTYRVMGHHEGDVLTGTYRTEEELEQWKKRCPILTYRQQLLESGLSDAQLDSVEERVEQQVQDAVDFALSSPLPDLATANNNVWAEPISPPIPVNSGAQTVTQGWMKAVCDGIAEEMRQDPNMIYLGEGIGERGGSFGHTKGLWQQFGSERVIDTPICEIGFTGAAIGASATGCRAVADLMFTDFMFESASQIIQQAAKLRYITNGMLTVPMVIRACTGTVNNAGPHHSGAYHPMWAHIPGLIIAVPSNPADAKGLFKTALRMNDPVIINEPKSLLASKGEVPVGEHFVPFGIASTTKEGTDITIVSCGLMVHRCMEAAAILERENISCEVIDLRTIVPLDVETIISSIAKTGHLLVVDESYAMCGIGGEIAAVVMEQGFDYLDAPAGRLHTDAVTVPFSPPLENEVTVNAQKVIASVKAVLSGHPIAPRRAIGYKLSTKTVVKPNKGDFATSASPLAAGPSLNSPEPSSNGTIAITVPHQDLIVSEVTVVKWLKHVGEQVACDEPVVEVETDKAVTDIESPAAGVLIEILAPEGTVAPHGQQIGTVKRNDK